MSFRLDRSRENDLVDAWGFLNVRPWRKKTLLSYGIMADLGQGFVSGLLRPALHQSLLRIPDEMHDYLIGPGRHRYR